MTEPVGLARGLTNYGDPDFALYLRRSFARSMGYSTDFLARPVIGIADTFSGFNNCHRHFPELIEAVKRGVLAMGGFEPFAGGPGSMCKASCIPLLWSPPIAKGRASMPTPLATHAPNRLDASVLRLQST